LAFYLQTAYEESHRVEDTPTAFEIETAAAMFAFYREGCQYAVVECGMGGRLDATNAIHNKVMAVILSIGLEHTAVLGDGIEQICAHKAGIIQNCPAVVSAYQTPEGMKYFKKLSVTIAEGVELVSANEDTQTFRYRGDEYTIAMYGTPQMYNAAVAVEVAIKLHLRNIAIKAGLKRAKILGRVERIVKNGVTYVLDGSHNPQSFTPFLEWARAHGGVDTLIYGCLADKDVHNASAQLAEITQNVIAVAPNSYRAMELNNIRQTLEVNFKEVQTANSVEQALQKATGNCIAVCGSFTLLKEAKDCILQGALS
jgi:dihydrofolate synthase/folylpolyglutamate synthase